MEKNILNFHFDYLPSLIITLFSENFTTFSTGFNHCNFSFRSRSRPFPRMEASDSLPEFWEWIFFIPFPFPNFGNGFFSFPSRSRISGMAFFHSLPVPEFREWIFSIPFRFQNFGNGFFPFPSRSRISGMDFFHSLPVPEFREWVFSIPFPFPNPQKSFPLTPGVCQSMQEYAR